MNAGDILKNQILCDTNSHLKIYQESLEVYKKMLKDKGHHEGWKNIALKNIAECEEKIILYQDCVEWINKK